MNYWMLIFSGIVALSTAVYAILTWQLVRETKKMRELSIAPHVMASLVIKKDWICDIALRIENIGAGAAQDVTLTLDKEIQRFDQKPVSKLMLFNKGIPILGPGQHIDVFIASGLITYWDDIDNPVTLCAKYQGVSGKGYNSMSVLDFELYKDFSMVEDNLHRSMARHLGEISKTLKQKFG